MGAWRYEISFLVLKNFSLVCCTHSVNFSLVHCAQLALRAAMLYPLFVIFLDFHSTKQRLSLVDSWSRDLD